MAQKQKQSRNVTLETVKQTFQATEFDTKPAKKKSKNANEDGLISDRSDDSDYNPDKAANGDEEDQALLQQGIWDDEENIIDEKDIEKTSE